MDIIEEINSLLRQGDGVVSLFNSCSEKPLRCIYIRSDKLANIMRYCILYPDRLRPYMEFQDTLQELGIKEE